MTDTPRRYAVVGTGHRSQMYIRALLGSHAEHGSLVAWCDTNRKRTSYYEDQVAAAGAPEVAWYHAADFDTMLTEQRPDRVIVTTPDYTHADYICAALDRGISVISEKPLTTTPDRAKRIVDALSRSSGDLTVTFNYRYSPRNSAVKQLLLDQAIGEVTSVHFEWLLDTSHGADYFRRWHRLKDNSGGLLIHKASHHFDLVNWWLDDVPQTVYAAGGLRFYGADNARRRGLGPRPELSRDTDPATDPFHLELADDPRLKRLYLDAEDVDGYHRDRDVFGDDITIEDSLSLTVGYRRGTTMSYSLVAFAPWEGYRIAFNGTQGRIELEVVERSWVPSAARGTAAVVDPSAAESTDSGASEVQLRPQGQRILLQRHWEPATEVPIPQGSGGHGGGDAMLLDDVFVHAVADQPVDDPLGRAAGYLDGIRGIIVGIAGNASLESGAAIQTADFGIPLTLDEVPTA